LSTEHIKTLTSLRFFAAAIVVVGHSAGFFDIPSDWARSFPHYHGVSFFFVLSGFILTIVYPQLPDTRSKFVFLKARLARVWPLHAVAFLAISIFHYLTFDWFGAFMISPQGLSTALLNLSLMQAWVPYTFYNMSFNPVSWSISVELFFYVAFLWLIQLRNGRWYLLPVIGLLPALAMIIFAHALHLPKYAADFNTLSIDQLLYVNPVARLFEFTLGMAAACLFKKRKTKISFRVGTMLEFIGLALFLVSLSLNYSIFETGLISEKLPPAICIWLERCGVSPLFAAIIVIFAFQSGAISRIFQQRFYVVAGEISYAIYILHPVILGLVSKYSPAPMSVSYALFLGITFWTSYFCWKHIETPLRRCIVRCDLTAALRSFAERARSLGRHPSLSRFTAAGGGLSVREISSVRKR
jgi:peptidoglycan/LPS O-acetylase OafA/YrhL